MSPRTISKASMSTSNINVLEDTSLDRVLSAQLRKLLDQAAPWALLLVGFIVAELFHHLWGGNPLAALGIGIVAVMLSVLSFIVTHHRGALGQLHAGLTPLGGGGWLAVAVQFGPTQRLVAYFLLVFGAGMALAWNIRVVVRRPVDDLAAGGDVLQRIFQAQAENAGLRGATMRTLEHTPGGKRIVARLRAAPGTTQGTVTKQVASVESALRLPPGAVSASPNIDRADDTDVVLSDPRKIREFTMWPGPSLPGHSIAEPLRVGVWQDGVDCTFTWLKFHLQAMGMTGSGKALAVDTPVPTPGGWTTMGDLQAGDWVFGADGRPGQVTHAWPVMHGRLCFEVVFSDGVAITADADHLWLVDTRRSRLSEAWQRNGLRWKPRRTAAHRPQQHKRVRPEVVTTAQIAASMRTPDGRHVNYSVRVAAPLVCPDADLPVAPYTLGAWLGDGHSADGRITSNDPEIIAAIEADGYEVHRTGRMLYQVTGIRPLLRAAGVLGDKHIPAAYLRASEAQRRALLAGLLDTDGHCTHRGAAQFTVTRERLARDVYHLVSSLGYKATLRSRTARLNGRDCGTAWLVSFTPGDKVFRLPRKVARQVTGTRQTAGHRYITAVRPVPPVPVRCIAVDSPDYLYLAGEACVPTHNSTMLAWSMLGEVITRRDAAVFGCDVSKGDQTLGALRPALHYFADTQARARALFTWLHAQIKPRTDLLAAQHLQSWKPTATYPDGTPMPLFFVWVEEFADVYEALTESQQDKWISSIRTARSAGILWCLSLQRSDWTQMPTLARGQLAKACMGVENSGDATFGLSELQQDRNAKPELWQAHQPGMAYLDAVGIEDGRRAMPLRFYSWGQDDRLISRHAAEFPATSKPLPHLVAASLAAAVADRTVAAATVTGDDDDMDSDDRRAAAEAIAEQVGDPDPDDDEAATIRVNPDQPLVIPEGIAGHRFAAADDRREEMDAERALELLAGQIAEWKAGGRESFDAPELLDVLDEVGRSRSWLYWALDRLAARGMIERTDDRVSSWTIHHGLRPLAEAPQDGADKPADTGEGAGGGSLSSQATDDLVSPADNPADNPPDKITDKDADTCPGCGAAPGTDHDYAGGYPCDWARCPECGREQQLTCPHGSDRPAMWHGIDPRFEVARNLGWWTTAAGIDHLMEDSTRVLAAEVLGQIRWDREAQRYVVGEIDEAAIDRALEAQP